MLTHILMDRTISLKLDYSFLIIFQAYDATYWTVTNLIIFMPFVLIAYYNKTKGIINHDMLFSAQFPKTLVFNSTWSYFLCVSSILLMPLIFQFHEIEQIIRRVKSVVWSITCETGSLQTYRVHEAGEEINSFRGLKNVLFKKGSRH